MLSRPCESQSVNPIRSLSISVSRNCEVKLGLVATWELWESYCSSPLDVCLRLGGVSDLRRKLRKEVLPEFRVPMTRMLKVGLALLLNVKDAHLT